MNNPGSFGNVINGGIETTRVRATSDMDETDARAAREADALAYLVRTGNADIAEILGLGTPRKRPHKSFNAVATRQTAPEKTCAVCGQAYIPTGRQQRTCGRSCGRRRSMLVMLARSNGHTDLDDINRFVDNALTARRNEANEESPCAN